MSLMRIKTEGGERGKDRDGGEEEEKRGGEAIRCDSAQPLAMTKWSNYA